MNIRRIKTELKRLRSASRYDERSYDLAKARQEARWEVLWYERFALDYRQLELDEAEFHGTPPPEPDHEHLARVAAARELLGDDSDERCARDQRIIEAYHLRRHGHMMYAPVWGHTRDELWTNHWDCLFGPGTSGWAEYLKMRAAKWVSTAPGG